jgi:O-acetylserine/cysteine efflux transporter
MKLEHFGLALLVVAVWGINFVVIKVGLHQVPPFLMVGLRFTLAAIPAMFFVRRPNVPWRYMIGFGLALGVIHFGLLFFGLKHGVSAGMGSLLLQLQAFFTAGFGFVILRERLKINQVAGMLLALAGIVVIATVRDESINPLGLGIVALSAAFWGVANIISKLAGKIDMLGFVVWSSLVPPIPLFALSWLLEDHAQIQNVFFSPSFTSIWSLAYITYLSTLFGFSVWTWLLSNYPTNRVAPLTLLVPVFGMASSSIFLGESFSAPKVLGALLVACGLIVNVFGDRLLALRARPA